MHHSNIRLPRTYPKSPPIFNIVDFKGIVKNEVANIKKIISSGITRMLGTEMIYELTTEVSAYITEHNIVSVDPVASLNEQMLEREEKQIKELAKRREEDEKERLKQEQGEKVRLAGLIESDLLRKKGRSEMIARHSKEKKKEEEIEVIIPGSPSTVSSLSMAESLTSSSLPVGELVQFSAGLHVLEGSATINRFFKGSAISSSGE